ncbi:hypothetical protein [Winogradskya humida]|uniref:Uncharacterized protein n=1 Tax=Winogradskya humida TaxID=113566 RepID=A0ABQ3ZPX4_9ACTN|nr:hypothetical protein [Actinoplanes humidus]GIE20635.1 hypothetical protein Ahu01nite_037370 [Actinoplanes humidus]
MDASLTSIFESAMATPKSVFYLVLATALILFALRYVKRAVTPIGSLLSAEAAAVVVAFAMGIAFVLVAAAAVGY